MGVGGWVDGVRGGWIIQGYPQGVGGWGEGWLGGTPTHVHMHMHAHTCMHTHARVVNMIISCKWPPPLGESLGIPYAVIHMCTCMRVCACVCVCMCMGDTLSPPHPHPPTPHPPGRTPRISQNSIALELIKIFQFCLKI